jgi:predicted DNA-binding protein
MMINQSPKKRGILIRLDDSLDERLKNVVEHYGQKSFIIRQAIEEKVAKLEQLKNKRAS